MGNYIYHSGTKGMKWYQRLYQYPDGSLTPLGRVHYGVGPPRGSRNSTTSESSGNNSKSSDFQDETPKRRTFRELSPEEQHEVMQDALERIRAKDSSVYGEFTIDDIKSIIDRAEQEAKLEQRANPQQQNQGNNSNQQTDRITVIDNKPVSEMSDQELKERLQRINSEIQYAEKTKKPTAMSKLKKALGVAKDVGQGAKDVAALYAQYEALKKVLDSRLKNKQDASGDTADSSKENSKPDEPSRSEVIRETAQTAAAAATVSKAVSGFASKAPRADEVNSRISSTLHKGADSADDRLAKLLLKLAAIGAGAITLKYVGTKSLVKAADKVGKVSSMAVPELINSVSSVADIGTITNMIFK